MMYVIVSYLIGAFPTAYLFGKLKRLDIRKHGSGNVGATNAWRVMGKGIGIITLLMDIAKGFFAVKFLPALFGKTGDALALREIYCGLAVILGHNFPIFLKFRGGKGVAASAGVILALAPRLIGWLVIVWGIVFGITGYVSLSSIIAGLSLPLFAFIFDYPEKFKWFSLILGILIVLRHRSNLRKLFKGEEKKLFTKKLFTKKLFKKT